MKKYYKSLDWIRILACISVLLYHLNVLPMGYLAVCTFFVLSGYLSVVSCMKKENFSILKYYKERFLKLYIPLLIVVLISISGVSFFPIINWLNLKPETTSVLLGYNNFWQLSVNLDYFARHISSPFMHFWYIAILLQFDLVFPILFVAFKKIGEKIHKSVPCILTFLLALFATVYFYLISGNNNTMFTYYDTFSRMFSLIFGVCLGFVHTSFETLIPKSLKKKPFVYSVFIIYFIALASLFIFEKPGLSMPILMILVTLITCRMIDYGTTFASEKTNWFSKSIKYLANTSFEIYLVQYPIIFLFEYIELESSLKLASIITLTLIISLLLQFALNFKTKKWIYLKILLCVALLPITCYGGYLYIITEDHTEEMRALEEELAQNEKMVEEKQAEYIEKLKQEQNDWLSTLSSIEDGEKKIAEVVKNLPIVGIGDSVMLGAVNSLYKQFPNSYFDAAISRTAWVVNGILKDLIAENHLGNPVILNLGVNGDCSEECKLEILETLKGKEIYWLNITDSMNATLHVNEKLKSLAEKYSNLHIVDWNQASKNHPEYFISDGVHLTSAGITAYTKTIYDAIYDVYAAEYRKQTDGIIEQHEAELKKKITFLGNDILLNAYEELENSFPNAKFDIEKETTYETLKQSIEQMIEEESLNYNVVLAIDSSLTLTEEEYESLIKLCNNHKVYLISTEDLSALETEDVKTINLSKHLQQEVFLSDKIHLNKEGNEKLVHIIEDLLGLLGN